MTSSPPAVPFITLAAYHAFGNTLTLEATFLTFSFISILRFPLLLIPHSYSLFFEAKVSIDRIEAFLALPESPRHADDGVGVGDNGAASSVAGSSVAGSDEPAPLRFKWDALIRSDASSNHLIDDEVPNDGNGNGAAAAPPALADATTGAREQSPAMNDVRAFGHADLTIAPGVHVVVGTVGAGKTTLLLGLLDELKRSSSTPPSPSTPPPPSPPPTAASELRPLRVGFSAQVPCIINATVKDNVIFGLPYDGPKYNAVLHASCLEEDLLLMAAGDETEIGERGVNLSGGQKASKNQCIAFHRESAREY